MLDRLEAMGFVRRQRGEEDRRQVLIYRTEKDRATEKQYVQLSEQMTEIWYRGFTDAEASQFEAYLERILDNLVQYENNMD
jgi:DNA-binding MarR family transcriptional regulator